MMCSDLSNGDSISYLPATMEASSAPQAQPISIVRLLMCALCTPSISHVSSRTVPNALEASEDSLRLPGQESQPEDVSTISPQLHNSNLNGILDASGLRTDAVVSARDVDSQASGHGESAFAGYRSSRRQLLHGRVNHERYAIA